MKKIVDLIRRQFQRKRVFRDMDGDTVIFYRNADIEKLITEGYFKKGEIVT